MIIKDPSKQTGAIVSDEGHLMTNAVVSSIENHHSEEHGSAFCFCSDDITMDGTDNTVLHIKNTSQTDNFYINKIMVSSDSDNVVKISFVKSGVYVSDGTLFTATNLNFSKANIAPSTSYYGNDITVSNGTTFFRNWFKTNSTYDIGGSIILGAGDSFSIKFNC